MPCREGDRVFGVARTRVTQYKLNVGKSSERAFIVTHQRVLVHRFRFDARASPVKDHREPQFIARAVDREHGFVIGKEAPHCGVQLDHARAGCRVACEFFGGLRIGRMNRCAGNQAILFARFFDGLHEAVGEVVSKRQAKVDGQDH